MERIRRGKTPFFVKSPVRVRERVIQKIKISSPYPLLFFKINNLKKHVISYEFAINYKQVESCRLQYAKIYVQCR